MIRVKLIRDLHIGKIGDILCFPEPMANYLIRVKAAKKVVERKKRTKKKKEC